MERYFFVGLLVVGGSSPAVQLFILARPMVRGREFSFRLTANPVQSVQRPDKPSDEQTVRLKAGADAPGTPIRRRGFRVAHRTADQQIGWLLKQTDRHGFTIPTAPTTEPAPGLRIDDPLVPAPAVALTARDILRFHKRTNGPRVTVSTATFQGRLRVTDPDVLRYALLTGISPAKGYARASSPSPPSRRRPRGAEPWWMAVTTTKSSPRPRG